MISTINLCLNFKNAFNNRTKDRTSFEKIFIIGGGEIYSQSISLSDEMILSHLDFDAEGDVYFPEYDKNDWDIKSTSKREKFEVVHYVRK